jgi:hypothetical protein
VALGYQALAITLHERQLDLEPFRSYASERGLVLIRGIERTVEGRHVLLLNFDRRSEDVETFSDLARLKQEQRGLVSPRIRTIRRGRVFSASWIAMAISSTPSNSTPCSRRR